MEKNLILVIAEDDFLIKYFINNVIEEYIDKAFKDIDFTIFSDRVNFEQVVNACLTPPVMSLRKVVVLNNMIKDLKFSDEEFINFLKELPPHLLLIIVISDIDKSNSFFKSVEKMGCVKDLRNITEDDRDVWIKRFAREFGKEITPEALEYLKINLDGDLYTIRNEVLKAVSISDTKDLIELCDIENVVHIGISENVFKLAEELGKKSFARSIKLFDVLIKEGEYIPSILAMINRHFRILLQVGCMIKDRDLDYIAKKLGLPKFITKKYLLQLKYFDEQKLKNIIQEGFMMDLLIKQGKIDPKVALELLIAKICA